MSIEPNVTGSTGKPYEGMGCPECGYDLTGTLEPRCPECGTAFDPAELRAVDFRRRLSWRLTIACVLLVTYLPNTWVFWIDYPWNVIRFIWIKAFPVLPGLFPSAWVAHWTGLDRIFQEYAIFGLGGTITLLLTALGVMLGRLGKRWLIPVCILIGAFEIFNASVCYGLFRM